MKIYSRINVYQQEVCTAYAENGRLFFSWHLAKSPLQHTYGRSLLRLRLKFPFVGVDDRTYEPGGQDQISLWTRGANNALRLLSDPDVIRAIRLFNLRLMKKGPCMFSGYHCFDLADRFYDQETDSRSPAGRFTVWSALTRRIRPFG